MYLTGLRDPFERYHPAKGSTLGAQNTLNQGIQSSIFQPSRLAQFCNGVMRVGALVIATERFEWV